MELWEIVFWVIVIVIIVWQLYAEFAFQRCYDGIDECGEQWNWTPQPGDGVTELVRRIELGNEATTLIIKRGLVVVGSGIVALTLNFFNVLSCHSNSSPGSSRVDPMKFIVTWAIVLGLFWAIFRYYESHYTHPISHRTQESIRELKYQLNIEQPPSL